MLVDFKEEGILEFYREMEIVFIRGQQYVLGYYMGFLCYYFENVNIFNLMLKEKIV